MVTKRSYLQVVTGNVDLGKVLDLHRAKEVERLTKTAIRATAIQEKLESDRVRVAKLKARAKTNGTKKRHTSQLTTLDRKIEQGEALQASFGEEIDIINDEPENEQEIQLTNYARVVFDRVTKDYRKSGNPDIPSSSVFDRIFAFTSKEDFDMEKMTTKDAARGILAELLPKEPMKAIPATEVKEK